MKKYVGLEKGGHQILIIASPRSSKSNVNAIKAHDILRQELEAILNSNSWKLTKPLRTIRKFFNAITSSI